MFFNSDIVIDDLSCGQEGSSLIVFIVELGNMVGTGAADVHPWVDMFYGSKCIL